jgi:Uncharacterized conserved protein
MKTLGHCTQFANENSICSLATLYQGRPHVRTMHMWYADVSGFYFQTIRQKELYLQLQENPWVEACFFKYEGLVGVTLRVAGAIEFVEDAVLKEKALAARSFLRAFGVEDSMQDIVLFRIAHGQAHFWDLENNLEPKEVLSF